MQNHPLSCYIMLGNILIELQYYFLTLSVSNRLLWTKLIKFGKTSARFKVMFIFAFSGFVRNLFLT